MSTYLVIHDTSPTHELSEYTDEYGAFYIINEVSPSTIVHGSNAFLTTDIGAYSLLPAIVADKAALLQNTKTAAIQKINKKLEADLSAGVVVSHDSLKVQRGDKVSNSIILDGSAASLVAFTQGATLISTAAALVPDPVAFGELQVSTIFGRDIIDSSNNVIPLTINQFRQMVLSLGSVVGNKQSAVVIKTAAINAATTAAQVKTILES